VPNQTKLPKYSTGSNFCGYPFFYVVDDHKCECNECATSSKADGLSVEAHVNYEDGMLYCHTCNEQIEASNGAHEEEESFTDDELDSEEELEQQRRDEKNGLYPEAWDDCN